MSADLTDETLEEKALRLGQLAAAEKDPVDKIALFVEAMLSYEEYEKYTAPHPEICLAMGKIGECISSFYRLTIPSPPSTLDTYACNEAYCNATVCRLYETAASYFDRSNLESVLEAREKLADLIDRGLYIKGNEMDGTPILFTREEVFSYRLITAEAGYPLSQLKVVEAYMEGDGVDRSWPKALLWAKRLCKNAGTLSDEHTCELMDLSGQLSQWEKNNRAVSNVREKAPGRIKRGRNLLNNEKDRTPLPPLSNEDIFGHKLIMAEAGDPLSQLNLVKAYMEGDGVDRSWPKALLWAKRLTNGIGALPDTHASDFMDLSAQLSQWEKNNPAAYIPDPPARKQRGVDVTKAGGMRNLARKNRTPSP